MGSPTALAPRGVPSTSESAAAPAASFVQRRLTLWLAPLLSAVLLYLSYFPVAAGWLAWFALVPWLCLVRLPGRPRGLYLACWLGGLCFYVPVLQWTRVADPRMHLTWVVLSLYCATYLPVTLAIVRRLDRRTPLPLPLTFPVVWVAVEFFRWGFIGSFVSLLTGSHAHDYPGGFGWYLLGHSQHDFLEVIQIADLAGAYGVGFVVAAVNALLFEALCQRVWFRRTVLGESMPPVHGKTALLIQATLVGAGLLGVLAYGVWRLGQGTTTPGPRLALLQGNVDQRLRNTAWGLDEQKRKKARDELAAHFSDLASLAARCRPDLIVWPETSYPGYWEEIAPGRPSSWSRELARDISITLDTPVLLGMNAMVGGPDRLPRSYNSAILLDGTGRWLGRYDKIHRVPFGEYIPLRSQLPLLNRLAPYDFDYAVEPGDQFTRFALPTSRGRSTFGVMICYEDTDPAMARPYGAGAPVDFLLNISNDGWFDGSSEHAQHLALCRFRAVETRRSVARAVNMGISAIIDSTGRVLAPELVRKAEVPVDTRGSVQVPIWEIADDAGSLPLSRWNDYCKVAGVLLGRPVIDTRQTVYANWGDWFATGCAGLALLGLVGTWRRKERER